VLDTTVAESMCLEQKESTALTAVVGTVAAARQFAYAVRECKRRISSVSVRG